MCEPFLTFVTDTQNPYFIYRLNGNSKEKGKDVMEVLKEVLEKMQVLL